MEGFQVNRKGGWDTHGLPVELQVEKELGITKEDIGKTISVEEYNARCRETVMKYKDQWDLLTQKMGYWVDLDNPYVTFDNDYIESLWFLLKKLFDKGLLYKGYTIQPYSPAAGTGLSSHELNQPGTYKEVKDTTITAQFEALDAKNEFFLAWTTTPWTLAGNTALAVGNNIDYVRVKTFNAYTFEPITVILARDRMNAYFNEKAKGISLEDYKPGDKLIPFEVIEEMKGSDLVGRKYKQLLPYVEPTGDAFRVIHGDFVSTEDGTGIVHISPTFGADDQRVANQNNIGAILVTDEDGSPMPIVDKQGRYVEQITDFAGRFVKNEYYKDGDAPERSLDVDIAIKLKEENRAFRVEKYEHTYPHCWRTDKPVLYYPLDSWFIRTTAYKEQLVALNNTINWKPASTGTGRFGNWLENLVDWNLSRSRYWGTPLPIWVSEDRTEQKCIGSLAELRDEIEKAIEAGLMQSQLPEDMDLHRPYVDELVLVSDSGQAMYREPDLIDVWFDSGAMPYAQWHYPFENNEVFEQSFPADFIAEGVDQTRGWFFTLHAIAGMLFDSVAFKNVIANGLVLDKNGNKMSKRLGNAVNPFETMDTYGPDATRWYMISNANPWDNLKFNLDKLQEVQRRFFGTLHNTYSFFALYANLDGFDYSEDDIPMDARTESDRWIISRLNSTIGDVKLAYQEYEPTRAARLIQDFTTDDLSNWYVRLNRKRFWRGDFTDDKRSAYQTLYTCIENIALLGAPIAPFYMDQLFQDLNTITRRRDAESVHLAEFPSMDESTIDQDLEVRMRLAQRISSLVHSLRKKHRLKVRQPLSKILVPVLSEDFKRQVEAVRDIILSEVNIKDIEFIDDNSGILVKSIKPNFRKLGQEYGSAMKVLAAAISKMSEQDISSLERTGKFEVDLGNSTAVLTPEDVEIIYDDIPGWTVASEEGVTIALDLTLTDELREEGIARDVVNRLQNLRKDMGLEVQDKIRIRLEPANERIVSALNSNKEYICRETQATSLEFEHSIPEGVELEIDDEKLKVKIDI